MQRILGIMTLMAAGLLVVALVISAGAVAPGGVARRGFDFSNFRIDSVSFALGALVGLGSIWLCRIPWGEFPRLLFSLLASWRRNVALASLAALCMGVLLFY